LPPTTLQQLAQRAARGDEAAFELLHHRLVGGLVRYLQRRTGEPVRVVEELAQTTWVEVWRSLQAGRYDPGRAAFSTFLYAVGAKVVLRHRRRRGRRRGRSLEDLPEEHLAHPGEDLGDLLDLCDQIEALRRCLDGSCGCLAEDERRILGGIARGLPEREVARQVGVPPSTAHDRKRAAFRKLRDCLQRSGRLPPGTGHGRGE
jgi:RNA polymerase sigma-70 factor (ECF subfamily)